MSRQAVNFWGEEVEVVIDSDETGNTCSAVIQTSPPGGGPAVHLHTREDECLLVLEGEYMFFETDVWRPTHAGRPLYAVRGRPHTYRNVGTSTGRLMAFFNPGQFEKLFGLLSPLSPEKDMVRIQDICSLYGVSIMPPDFAPPPPSAAEDGKVGSLRAAMTDRQRNPEVSVPIRTGAADQS